MYTLNNASTVKKMTVNELIFENYYKQIAFFKGRFEKKRFVIACNQLIERIADARNGKEYYNSYLKRKSTKLVKRS